MSILTVGVTQSIRRADGTMLIPEFDLSPLVDDPAFEVSPLPDVDTLSPEDLAPFDAVILGLEAITAASFDDGPCRLALAARYGVGYDRIDVGACTANDVALAITPSGVRRPVAVAVIAFMLALTTRMLDKDRITRLGPPGWARKNDYTGMGLVGRTLGVVGAGNIGAEVFAMAAPFDMRFLAYDPAPNAELTARYGVEFVSLETVFRESDVVSVNCPLTPATVGLVSAELLALMKPTAYLINTSRGPVVDQQAITEVLAERRIAGAALDVLEKEPPDPDDPLLKLDNVIFAPHALCWTDQCFAGMGAADVAAVQPVRRGEAPEGLVNPAVAERPGFEAKLARLAG